MEGFKKRRFNNLPSSLFSQSSGFMRGSFGELFVPLSTMGKGKEPPLSWINVIRKKVVILGQALKIPFQFWNFLGLNNPIFWLNFVFGYQIFLKWLAQATLFKECPRKKTAYGQNQTSLNVPLVWLKNGSLKQAFKYGCRVLKLLMAGKQGWFKYSPGLAKGGSLK